MAETTQKTQFGRRITRAFAYGLGIGFVFYVLGYVAAHTISGLPPNLGAIGFVIGLGSTIGIELSKETGK